MHHTRLDTFHGSAPSASVIQPNGKTRPACATSVELVRQASIFNDSLVMLLMNAMTENVMILNRRRQVVFANNSLLAMLERDGGAEILGKRPGDLFQCVHSSEPGGCGATSHCAQCGTANTIFAALDSSQKTEACRLLTKTGKGLRAYDLQVCATPFAMDGEGFIIFAFQDVSHEKRRRSLERVFFHDMKNSLGGLRNIVELVHTAAPEDIREETQALYTHFSELTEEIDSQQLLLEAESGELVPNPGPVNTKNLLEATAFLFSRHDVARDKRIVLSEDSVNVTLATDHALLKRVLGNLVKNALEASRAGDAVTLCCGPGRDGGACISVHNPGAMEPEVSLQLFKRSFSTKGKDRGLGTYGVRLFVENSLGGSVSFTSSPGDGTTFTISLPDTIA